MGSYGVPSLLTIGERAVFQLQVKVPRVHGLKLLPVPKPGNSGNVKFGISDNGDCGVDAFSFDVLVSSSSYLFLVCTCLSDDIWQMTEAL